MSKKKVVILGVITTAVVGGVIAVKRICKHDPNDISRSIRRMSDKEVVDIVEDMTEEELYEYAELIKDRAQRDRVYIIKEIADVLKDLEKHEDS